MAKEATMDYHAEVVNHPFSLPGEHRRAFLNKEDGKLYERITSRGGVGIVDDKHPFQDYLPTHGSVGDADRWNLGTRLRFSPENNAVFSSPIKTTVEKMADELANIVRLNDEVGDPSWCLPIKQAAADASLRSKQMQEALDWYNEQREAAMKLITGQHQVGHPSSLDPEAFVFKASVLKASEGKPLTEDILRAAVSAMNPTPQRRTLGDEIRDRQNRAKPPRLIMDIKTPAGECAQLHPEYGIRCTGKIGHAGWHETPMGKQWGKVERVPERKVSAFGVVLQLPEGYQRPKDAPVPVPTPLDQSGENSRRYEDRWGGIQRKTFAVSAMNLDTLNNRLPRRWTKDAWRTR